MRGAAAEALAGREDPAVTPALLERGLLDRFDPALVTRQKLLRRVEDFLQRGLIQAPDLLGQDHEVFWILPHGQRLNRRDADVLVAVAEEYLKAQNRWICAPIGEFFIWSRRAHIRYALFSMVLGLG